MLRKALSSLLLQEIILALLLLAGLYAMTFTLHEEVLPEGGSIPRMDQPYLLRASLVIGGLIGAILSLALLIRKMIRGWKESEPILEISMTLCSLTIGWAALPYLANGVSQALRGDFLVGQFDPKSEMPMVWIGGFWYVGVLLILFFAYLGVPTLFAANVEMLIRRRLWKQGIITTVCLAITAMFFLLSPNYFAWLSD